MAAIWLALSMLVLVAGVRGLGLQIRTAGIKRRLTRRATATLSLPVPPPRIARALARAAVARPDVAWTGWISVSFAGGLLALVVAGPSVLAVVALVAVVAPTALLHGRRDLADRKLEAALPEGLEALARSVRSGASLAQAFGEVAMVIDGPLGRELKRLVTDVDLGEPLIASLEAMATESPLPGVRLAVAALCLGSEVGGAQARALDGVATTLRDRAAVAGEAKALASQARLSAMVIGLAPLAFGAFAAATDSRTADFLFHTPMGLALLLVGLGLDGLGWLWMQRICQVP